LQLKYCNVNKCRIERATSLFCGTERSFSNTESIVQITHDPASAEVNSTENSQLNGTEKGPS
jgi:hypothetical protein